MSEFSIEEKAKRYDEAIDKAKKWYNAPNVDKIPTFANRIIEDIFPEFKESENEKIRKWLIAQLELKSDVNNSRDLELMILKSIEWLEKQNEPSIKWNENTKENKPPIYHSILMKTTHGIAEGEWRGECWCQYRWSTNHIKDNDVLAWMELSDLDKSADKIEPKFKAGDWVAINPELRFTSPLYIKDIDKSNYRVESLDGNSGAPTIDYLDNHYHLWSIKDAKEGDILITENENPFIFKGFSDKFYSNKPVAYGGIVDSGYFSPCSNNCTNRWTDGDVYPAIQEQRDLLFREIKEAGYKWNSDEKQLIRMKKQ